LVGSFFLPRRHDMLRGFYSRGCVRSAHGGDHRSAATHGRSSDHRKRRDRRGPSVAGHGSTTRNPAAVAVYPHPARTLGARFRPGGPLQCAVAYGGRFLSPPQRGQCPRCNSSVLEYARTYRGSAGSLPSIGLLHFLFNACPDRGIWDHGSTGAGPPSAASPSWVALPSAL
jgi:hypothetical protein